MPTIWCELEIGSNTYDVSNLVLRDGVELRYSVGGKDYRPTRDSASITLRYDAALALALVQAQDTVKIAVDIDGSPVFRGQVRPSSDLVVRNDVGEIVLECLDNSYLLDVPLGARKYLLNTPIYSGSTHLVGELIAGTGVQIDANAPAITTVIPEIVFEADDNRLETLSDLLYWQGWTLYWTPAGKLSWRLWVVTGALNPTYTWQESATNIVDEMTLTREELSRHDGVELEYTRITTATNAELHYRDIGPPPQNNGNTLLEGAVYFSLPYSFRPIKLSNLRLKLDTTSINYAFNFPFRVKDNPGVRLPLVAGALGGGVRVARADVNSSLTQVDLKLVADNSGYGGTQIERLWIYADVTVEERGLRVRSSLTPNASNPYQIRARYLRDHQTAQDLADSYWVNVVSNPYTVRLQSYVDRPVGEIVTVNTSTGNWQMTGVIYSKTYRHSERIYTYQIRSVTPITPATPQAPTYLPPQIPVVDDLEDVVLDQTGGADPAVVLSPQAPAEINRGLIVRAAGREMLNLTYSHVVPYTLYATTSPLNVTHPEYLSLDRCVVDGKLVRLGTDGSVQEITTIKIGNSIVTADYLSVTYNGQGVWAYVVNAQSQRYAVLSSGQEIVLPGNDIRAVAVDGQRIIGHDLASGLRYLSTDGGATWATTPQTGSITYAQWGGSLYTYSSAGLYRDDDLLVSSPVWDNGLYSDNDILVLGWRYVVYRDGTVDEVTGVDAIASLGGRAISTTGSTLRLHDALSPLSQQVTVATTATTPRGIITNGRYVMTIGQGGPGPIAAQIWIALAHTARSVLLWRESPPRVTWVSSTSLSVRGKVLSDSGDAILELPLMTKTTAAWAAGNNAGAVLGSWPNNTWARVWIIATAAGQCDVAISTTLNPTLPTGYIYKRRVGWVYKDGSGNLRRWLQWGTRWEWWDQSGVMTGAGWIPGLTRVEVTVRTPPRVILIAYVSVYVGSGGGSVWVGPASRANIGGMDSRDVNTPTPSGPHNQDVIVTVPTDQHSRIAVRNVRTSSLESIEIKSIGWIDPLEDWQDE